MQRVKALGQTAVAITDHGVMYGCVDFYKAAKKAGVKPIIGCEVYVATRTRFDKVNRIDGSNHLVLLCKNETGYKNLIKMVSAGFTLSLIHISIKYNLLFERFLNPERVSMPDFDIDFCYERRQEVIDYVIRKYGADHVAQIVTFGTMAARAAIRDVGRVLDMPYGTVDGIAKLVPMEPKMTLTKALSIARELKARYDACLLYTS